jgi:A/G-specific adenine glycosylase
VLRDTDGEVTRQRLDEAWSDEPQRIRCLAGLVADGLAVRTGAGTYALP